MTLSKKKLAWILAGVLALHLVIAGAKRMGDFMAFFYGNHPNNYFSLLAANGWQEVEVIEDVASPVSERHGGWAGCTGLTRVLLAEKAGKTHLICVDRSHLEDWSGPSEAEALEGEFAGLERICFFRYPLHNTYGGFGEQELIQRPGVHRHSGRGSAPGRHGADLAEGGGICAAFLRVYQEKRVPGRGLYPGIPGAAGQRDAGGVSAPLPCR